VPYLRFKRVPITRNFGRRFRTRKSSQYATDIIWLISSCARIFWAVSVPLAVIAYIWFVSPLPEWYKQTFKDFRRISTPRGRWEYLKLAFRYKQVAKSVKRREESSAQAATPAELARARRKVRGVDIESVQRARHKDLTHKTPTFQDIPLVSRVLSGSGRDVSAVELSNVNV
jgi:hypothetical protein